MNLESAQTSATAPGVEEFQRDLIALIPYLRAQSQALCGKQPIAEDMAQEALAKAWRARGRFAPGTNLKAWLSVILRNSIYSQSRRMWREMSLTEVSSETIRAAPREQEWAADLLDAARALDELPRKQRNALILVGAGGFTHEDAAAICGTPVNTMKTCVARGRASMQKMLDGERLLPRRPSISGKKAAEAILAQVIALSEGTFDASILGDVYDPHAATKAGWATPEPLRVPVPANDSDFATGADG